MVDFLSALEIDSKVKPVRTNMSPVKPDLTYDFGYLTLPASGLRWKAVSGSGKRLKPLPTGWYKCSNFRKRTDGAMVREGVGFSVDLEPLFSTERTLLRIHPDGGKSGTAGCIGITDADLGECEYALKRLLPFSNSVAYLLVRTLF